MDAFLDANATQLDANAAQLATRTQLNQVTDIAHKLLVFVEKKNIIIKKTKKINDLQSNILNIMEIYDILYPILKEKYIIEKIINMKYDMELYKVRQELSDLTQTLD